MTTDAVLWPSKAATAAPIHGVCLEAERGQSSGSNDARHQNPAPTEPLTREPLQLASALGQGKASGDVKQPWPLWKMLLLALPCVALGWIATLAAVALMSDSAPARFVLLPPASILSAVPEANLVDAGALWLTLASDAPGFTQALYRAGALLVLPAGLTPCGITPGSTLKFP